MASATAERPSKAYKYTILAIGFVASLIADSSYNISGLFYAAHTEAFPDQTTLLSAVYGMTYGVGQLLSPAMALLVQSLGERRVAIGCSLCMFSGYAISFFATDARLLLLTFGLMVPVAAEGMYFYPMTLLAFNFEKRLTMASGVVASGCGTGLVISAPLAQLLITSITWRGAVLALGAAALNAGALALLIQPRRKSSGATAAPAEAAAAVTAAAAGGRHPTAAKFSAMLKICGPDTVFFFLTALLQTFGTVTVINFVPVLARDLAVPDTRIALYPACYGAAFTLGNLAFGYLGTRCEPFVVNAISLLASSLLTGLLPSAMQHAEMLGLAIYSGMGACQGGRYALMVGLLRIAVGLQFYEICTGFYVATFFFGSFSAPFVGQRMKQLHGSYQPAFFLAAAVFAAASMTAFAACAFQPLWRRQRRRERDDLLERRAFELGEEGQPDQSQALQATKESAS